MKKQKDTMAIIEHQLKMIDERLNDMQYAEIWPQLMIQKEKILKHIKS